MARLQVVVREQDLSAYEARGYALSKNQGVWGRTADSTEKLYVVEMEMSGHERLNQCEQVFRLVGFNTTRIDREYRIERVDVLERDKWSCFVAPVGAEGAGFGDGGAEQVHPDTIYATTRECAAGNAASLREKVRLLREAADNIEEFMVRIECPPAGEKQ